MKFSLLDGCDQIGHARFVQGREIVQVGDMAIDRWKIHGFNHVIDDALKPHPGSVFRRVDFGHAISFQLPDFIRNNHAAPASENLDMGGPAFF